MEMPFPWVAAPACGENFPAGAGGHLRPKTKKGTFFLQTTKTKRGRIWRFLGELSSQLSLRWLCAKIQARNTRLLISDVFASLFGNSHRFLCALLHPHPPCCLEPAALLRGGASGPRKVYGVWGARARTKSGQITKFPSTIPSVLSSLGARRTLKNLVWLRCYSDPGV